MSSPSGRCKLPSFVEANSARMLADFIASTWRARNIFRSRATFSETLQSGNFFVQEVENFFCVNCRARNIFRSRAETHFCSCQAPRGVIISCKVFRLWFRKISCTKFPHFFESHVAHETFSARVQQIRF